MFSFIDCRTCFSSRVAGGLDRPVSEQFCPGQKPALFRECRIECKIDCTLSHWSSWSPCVNTACTAKLSSREIGKRQQPIKSQFGITHGLDYNEYISSVLNNHCNDFCHCLC